ncbi:MAG: sugar ABC transporter permease [Desulfuromonadaceae bacterium]|nr:sugar ABC transporter permease [Desulfuromonadaceae bacterium]
MKKDTIYIFLIPSLIGFLIFFLIPFVGSLYYAYNVDGRFSLYNFVNTLQNEAFQLALKNTLLFLLICVPLNMILPLLVAIAVKSIGEQSRLFRLAYISPLVVPVASVAIFWSIRFAPGGTVGRMLGILGIPEIDFLHSGWAVFVVALIYLWKNLGYMMVLYLAGLSEVPGSYYESASMDGAGAIQTFRKITLPCLRPTIFFVLVMSVVNCFKVFREMFLITGAYPDESVYMLQHYMNNMFRSTDYGRLTSAAFIITAIITIFLIFMFRLNHRAQRRLGR